MIWGYHYFWKHSYERIVLNFGMKKRIFTLGIFTPNLGEDDPISLVFFRWIGSTTNQNFCFLLMKFPGCIPLKMNMSPKKGHFERKIVFQKNQVILGGMLKFGGVKLFTIGVIKRLSVIWLVILFQNLCWWVTFKLLYIYISLKP